MRLFEMGVYFIGLIRLQETLGELEDHYEHDGVNGGLGEERGTRGESDDNTRSQDNEQNGNQQKFRPHSFMFVV
jgi:hypothetical protein